MRREQELVQVGLAAAAGREPRDLADTTSRRSRARRVRARGRSCLPTRSAPACPGRRAVRKFIAVCGRRRVEPDDVAAVVEDHRRRAGRARTTARGRGSRRRSRPAAATLTCGGRRSGRERNSRSGDGAAAARASPHVPSRRRTKAAPHLLRHSQKLGACAQRRRSRTDGGARWSPSAAVDRSGVVPQLAAQRAAGYFALCTFT